MRNVVRPEHSLPSRCLAGFLASLTFFALTPGALAAPQGEQVTRGQATFSRDGAVTTIRTSKSAIIDYSSFDILQNETVQFVQPSASSRVLNRIHGADPTKIDGSLLGNGRVYIVNPYGVYFGGRAVVDVAGLFAAAGAMSNEDFLARRDRFTNLDGRVVNLGSIRGEIVSLLGDSVANYGSIVSRGGLIALVSGNEAVLVPVAGKVRVRVASNGAPGAAANVPGVENAGSLDAGDGAVSLAAGDLYSLAVRQTETGSIAASDIRVAGGATGTVRLSGSLDASNLAAGERGGSIQVTGEKIALAGATLDASGDAGGGRIRVGGDFHGAGAIPTAARTYVSSDSTLRADAVSSGDGGTAVVWADELTGFYGHASARGGARGGDGGALEISGKQSLVMAGTADTRAPRGRVGSLLLDPTNVSVIDGAGGADDGQLDLDQPNLGDPEGEILAGDPGALFVISEQKLESLSAGTDVNIEATNDITIANLADDLLDLTSANSVAFKADADLSGAGAFAMNAGDEIQTGSADLAISGASVSVGKLTTGAGNITLSTTTATGPITLNNAVTSTSGDVSFQAPVVLAADITVNSGSGDAEFQDTVDSVANQANELVVTSSGTTRFAGDVGTTDTSGTATDTGLGRLETNGGGTTVIGDAAGAATRTVRTIDGLGATASSGDQVYADAVVLDEDTQITAADTVGAGTRNVTFASTVNSVASEANELRVTTSGTTRFEGDVGTTDTSGTAADTGLGRLETDGLGTTVIGSTTGTGLRTIRTIGGLGTTASSGDQVYSDDAVLDENAQVTAEGAAGTRDVEFSAAVDSAGGETNNLNVDAEGAVTFVGDVGGSDGLAVLSAEGVGGVDVQSDLNANGVTLHAGDASTALSEVTLGATSVVNGAAGAGTSPTAFALEQDTDVATGDVTFGDGLPTNTSFISDDGDVTVDAAIDYDGVGANGSLTLAAANDVNIDSDITDGAPLSGDLLAFSAYAGTDGTGLVTFAAPTTQVWAESVTLRAGDGTDSLVAVPNTAIVDLTNANLRGTGGLDTAPTTFVLQQDESIADAVDPAVFGDALVVGDPLPTNYTLQSDEGTVAVATAARVNGTPKVNLTVSGEAGVSLAAGLDLASLDASAPNTLLAPSAVIALDGDITTTGDQLYQDAVQLDDDVVLNAGNVTFQATVDSAAGLANELLVTASGTTRFAGNVGTTDVSGTAADTGLGRLETNGGGTTVIGDAATATTRTVRTIDGLGATASSGDQVYADAVVLDEDTQITAADTAGAGTRNVTFASTVNSAPGEANDLAVTTSGTTRFAGNVGTTDTSGTATDTGLGRLETNGGGTTAIGDAAAATRTIRTIDGLGTTASTGDQVYADAVVLDDDTQITAADAAGAGTRNVTFASTVNSAPGEANDLAVTTSGTTRFAGNVGTTDVSGTATDTGLGALVTDAAGSTHVGAAGASASTITLRTIGGVASSTGNQSFNDDVVLDDDSVSTAAGASGTRNVSFADTVSSESAEANTLLVNSPGTTTFAGTVGGGASASLGSLETDDAGTLAINADVTTSGNQTYNDSAITTGGAAPRTLTSTAGSITLGNAGTDTLAVNAATTASATAGTVDLNATTTLAGDLTLSATTVTVDGAINGDASAATSSDLALNGSGATTIASTIGATAIESVTSDDAGTLAINADVTTSGNQIYNDSAITIGGASPRTLTSGGGITLGNATTDTLAVNATTTASATAGTIDLNATTELRENLTLTAATITLDGTIDEAAAGVNASNLALNGGATTIANTIGGVRPIDSVTSNDAGTLAINADVTTSGSQTYNDSAITIAGASPRTLTSGGSITLGNATTDTLAVNATTTASATAGTVDLNATTELREDLTLTAATITLDGTINEAAAGVNASNLALNGGATTIANTIGGVRPIDSVTSDDAGTLAINADVTTSGSQTYDDSAITTGGAAPRTLTSGGSITLGNAGTDTLAVNVATTASATAGTVDLNATTTLAGDLTLTGSIVTLDATVDDDASAATSSDLALNGSGATTIASTIGATAIESVTSNDAGTLAINADVTTSGSQIYNDSAITIGGAAPRTLTSTAGGITLGNAGTDTLAVNVATTASATAGTLDLNAATTLAGDLTLSATTLTLDGAINDDASGATSSDLALNGSGATTIASTIGATAIESVTSNDAGTLAINADVTTSGNQTYNDSAITIGGAAPRALTSTAGGITLGNAAADTLAVNVATTASATAGTVDLNATTTLAGDLTLSATTLTLDGAINDDASGATSSDLALNGSGATTIASTIGATAIESVTSNDAGTLAINADVTTSGSQIYNDSAITIGGAAPRTLTSTAGGITLGNAATDTLAVNTATTASATAGTVDLNATTTLAGDLTLGAATITVDGAINDDASGATSSDLALNGSGATTIASTIGATAIESVTSNDAGTLAINADVTTSGSQIYNDSAITIGGAAPRTLTSTAGGITLGNTSTDTLAVNVATTASATAGTVDLNATTTLAGDLTLGATTITVDGAINDDASGATSSDLALNGSGATTIASTIGATAIESVTSNDAGTLAINADVTTSGSQIYNDSAITIGGAAPRTLTSTAGSITLGNATTDTLAVNAATTASATAGTVDLNATTTLAGDLTLSATTLTLDGAINDDASGATSSDLALNGSGATTIASTIGATAIESVTSNDAGTLAINADVTTSGSQIYNDSAITIGGAAPRTLTSTAGSITLGNATTDTLAVNAATTASATAGTVDLNATTLLQNDLALSGSIVTLDATVDEAAAPTSSNFDAAATGALTVGASLGASAALDSIDLDGSTIEFTSAAPMTLQASSFLTLNDPSTVSTPTNATIFKRSGNLSLLAPSVTIGRNQKLTVVGDLAIVGNGPITVGDLTALNLTVDAGAGVLNIWGRAGAATGSGGGPDTGTDLVANSIALDAGSFAIVGGSQLGVKLGAVNGGGPNLTVNGSQNVSSPFVPVPIFEGASSRALVAADLVSGTTVLDLEAAGQPRGSQRPPPNPLAMLLARPSGGVNVAAASEKPLRDSEVAAFLDCDPEDLECQEKAVGAARARSAEAQNLKASYAKLFGAAAAPAAGAAAPQDTTPKAVLQRSVDAFRKQTNQEPSGVAFRQFCESAPEHARSVEILDNMRSVFRYARALGQTGEGLGNFKQQKLQEIAPEGITLEALDAAVEAGGITGAAPAKS